MPANIFNQHYSETELYSLFQEIMPLGLGIQKVEFGSNDSSATIYFDDVTICNRVQFVLQKHIPFDKVGPRFFSFQDRDMVAAVLTMFKTDIARQIKIALNPGEIHIMDPKD